MGLFDRTEYYNNGKYVGQFSNGKRHGRGTYYCPKCQK